MLVFPRLIVVISLYGTVLFAWDKALFFSASRLTVFPTCCVHTGPSLQTKNHVNLFTPAFFLCLSPTPCSNYMMLLCAGVPQRPRMKFIGPESCHLTREMWLTDFVPFPISSGSRVTLTFPASGLYLNREHQRLMAAWEILLSTLSICLT